MHSATTVVFNGAWSPASTLATTGTSDSSTEIPREDIDFCEDGQTLANVAQRVYAVSALGGFTTQWNMALSNLSQLIPI